MQLRGLTIEGFRHGHGAVFSDWGSRVEAPAGASGMAIADALTLVHASLSDEAGMAAGLARLGVAAAGDVSCVVEQGRVVQVSWPDAHGVLPLLHPHGMRRVTARLSLSLDPRLFGVIREHAVREPRLVAALGADASLTLGFGWLFTNDHTTAAVGLHQVKLGGVAFALAGPERPGWLEAILPMVRDALHRVPALGDDGVAMRLHDAMLSSDMAVRAGFARAAAALGEAPFSLGRLELVGRGDAVEAAFGPDLVRQRQLGVCAAEALRLVEAVCITQPDVLIVESPGVGFGDPLAVRDWLASATKGDDATLEQVLIIPGAGR